MEQHREMIRSLLSSRERRESKHDISRLSLDEVLGELGYRGCALDGPDATLRERLLRAVFREQEPENRDIPSYPWHDAVVMDEERESEHEENEPRDVGEGERKAGRGDGAPEAQCEESGSPRSGGQQPNIIVLEREDVMVHVAASATTATSTVTQAVTTVAASSSGTTTAVTPLTYADDARD